jgi:O-antigen/teichoic acid export membrane protein
MSDSPPSRTVQPSVTHSATATQVPADLGHRAARGLVWLIGQTIGVKFVSMLANVVLARFLAPTDAGLVAMAYTVLAIAGIVQFVGMQDVLVQRQRSIHLWMNPAFWLLLTLGVLGGIMTAAAAPLAASIYGEPRLVGMVLLLAVSAPLQTISVIPQALLSAQLKFRTTVILGTITAVGTSVLSIILAWQGWGAYSYIAPLPIMAAFHLAALWFAARPRIYMKLQVRRWRYFIADASFNWGFTICMIAMSADHVALSLLFPAAVIGVYFWAVNLSTQLLRLLANNLANVLLPSLSKLHDDPQRQATAFVQAMRVLAMIGIPACFLQAAVAEPAVELLYQSEWRDMAPILAFLSIGMAFSFVSGPGTSIMKARRQFRMLFLVYLTNTIAMITVVLAIGIGSTSDTAALRMAVGVSATIAVFGPINLYFAVRGAGHGIRDVFAILASPTIAGAISILTAVAISKFIPDWRGRNLFQIVVTIVLAMTVYPILISLLDRRLWHIAKARLRNLRPQWTHSAEPLPLLENRSTELH